MTTPERKAEIMASFEEICGRTSPPRPKVVIREDLGVIRDADVAVSPADKNAPARDDEGFVQVRRADYVTINIPLREEQQRWKAEERRRNREIDEFRQGLYGPVDDDED
jgi:hypothetical protein